MNFLVVLGFDLLFVNLDVFFVKSPKTTKAPIFLRFQNWYGFTFSPSRITRKTPAKSPQTPAKPRKRAQIRKRRFLGSGVAQNS